MYSELHYNTVSYCTHFFSFLLSYNKTPRPGVTAAGSTTMLNYFGVLYKAFLMLIQRKNVFSKKKKKSLFRLNI